MKIRHLLMAFAAPAAFAAAPAEAAIYTFDLTGGYAANWTIDTDTMVDNYAVNGQGSGFYDVAGTFGGQRTTALSVNFFNLSNDGGLSIELDGSTPFFTGAQLYNGAEGDFAFRTGRFALNGAALTIGTQIASGVPEPTTWMTLLAGFTAIGLALRARRAKAAVALA